MTGIPGAPVPSRPGMALPSGAWDCHVHVFGPASQFPFAPDRRYTPGLADTHELRAMMQEMGMAHAVIVQATPFGADHSCLKNALREMGPACVGVASFPPASFPDDKELDALKDAGVVALRVHTLSHTRADATEIALSALPLLRRTGWHLEVQCDGDQLEVIEELGNRFDGPIILDHIARITCNSLDRLVRLAGELPVYVKLSGFYRNPCPEQAVSVARALLQALPMRVMWGSDWPHTPLAGSVASQPNGGNPFLQIDATSDFEAVFEGMSDTNLAMCLAHTPKALYLRDAPGLGT